MKPIKITESFDFNSAIDDTSSDNVTNTVASELFYNEFVTKYLPLWNFSGRGSSMSDISNKIEFVLTHTPFVYKFIVSRRAYDDSNKVQEFGTMTVNGTKISFVFNDKLSWAMNTTPTNDAFGFNYNLEYIFQLAIELAKNTKYTIDSVEVDLKEIAFHNNRYAPWTVCISAEDVKYFPTNIKNKLTFTGTPDCMLTECTFKDEEAIDAFTKYLNILYKDTNPVRISVKHCRMKGESMYLMRPNTGETARLIKSYVKKNILNQYKKERMTKKKWDEYHKEQIAKGNFDYMY